MRTQDRGGADELEVPPQFAFDYLVLELPPKALGVVGTYRGIVHSPNNIVSTHKGSFTTYRLSFFLL
jgi:hypothetical protein